MEVYYNYKLDLIFTLDYEPEENCFNITVDATKDKFQIILHCFWTGQHVFLGNL